MTFKTKAPQEEPTIHIDYSNHPGDDWREPLDFTQTGGEPIMTWHGHRDGWHVTTEDGDDYSLGGVIDDPNEAVVSAQAWLARRSYRRTGWAEDPELIRRAFAAYFRSGANQQPDASASNTVVHEGKTYVVLTNVNGILAVYRVLNDGGLKGLRRWPKGVEEHFA